MAKGSEAEYDGPGVWKKYYEQVLWVPHKHELTIILVTKEKPQTFLM